MLTFIIQRFRILNVADSDGFVILHAGLQLFLFLQSICILSCDFVISIQQSIVACMEPSGCVNSLTQPTENMTHIE